MEYERLIAILGETNPRRSVTSVEHLITLVNLHHKGVGQVSRQFFPNFEGAQAGHFLWLPEDRTSPHDDAFNDAIIYINDLYRDDAPMRRLIACKELMHVFDTDKQKANTPTKLITLIQEIESSPPLQDSSDPYTADRIDTWKALIALVPPWEREKYRLSWDSQTISANTLATRWVIPEFSVRHAMGLYYPKAVAAFKVN